MMIYFLIALYFYGIGHIFGWCIAADDFNHNDKIYTFGVAVAWPFLLTGLVITIIFSEDIRAGLLKVWRRRK